MAKQNDSLLPEDTAPSIDMSELRVDFSDKEASSEAMSFDVLPTGKYRVAITEWELRRSNSQKHNGKPYWALTLVVQDGKYEGRKLWTNVMLFNEALYSLAQLMKAIGREDVLESGKIPHGDELIGKEVIAVVAQQVDKYKIEQGEWEEGTPKPKKAEVKGFKPLDAIQSGSSGNSLMP